MVAFLSVSSFRARLEALLKVKRGVYAGVTQEICNAFANVGIDQIRQNRDMILMDDDEVVIKLRLPDKKQKLSKSDGYRLIYMAMKLVPVVVFLDIYPKRGPMQQLDIEDKEVKRLMKEFLDEMAKGSVVQHDVDNLLAVMVTDEVAGSSEKDEVAGIDQDATDTDVVKTESGSKEAETESDEVKE